MVCRVIDTNKNNFNSISDKNDSTPITIRVNKIYYKTMNMCVYIYIYIYFFFFPSSDPIEVTYPIN